MTSFPGIFPITMAASLFCWRCCRHGTGFNTGHVPLRDLPTVKLDTGFMGTDVVIVKNGRRICGTGAALANAPIHQNKAYFEIKLQSTGSWGIGLATKKCDVNTVPLGADSETWVLRQDGKLYHSGEERGKLPETPQEGDILGMSYDHLELNFYLNGKEMATPFTGIKGTMFPVFYVDDGAIIDVQFSGFYHPPPPGFEEIMIEKSLL